MGNIIPQGSCTKKTLVLGEELEDRNYNLEDSLLLRTLMYEDAFMIKNNFVTVVPDVKDKKPIYKESIDTEYQSAATGGRGKTECGSFRGDGKYNEVIRYIYTFYLYNEIELCYKTLIGKWKQTKLNKGAGNIEENTTLNDFVVQELIKNNNKQTDELIWWGDYKSPQKRLAHFDGIVKKMYQAITAVVAQVDLFTFSGVQNGDYIEGYAGGYSIKVPFNGSQAQTLIDLASELSDLKSVVTGEALYTVATLGSPKTQVRVTANIATIPNDITLLITDGTGLDSCEKATVAGVGTVTYSATTPFVKTNTPITTTYETITVSNILAKLADIYTAINTYRPELLNDPNFRIFVSPTVWGLMALAVTNTSGGTKGLDILQDNPPYALPIVKAVSLKGSFIVGFSSDNVFFGTDLISDLSNADQWIDKDKQVVKFRNETMQGVQIADFTETICNFDGNPPFNFQEAQPEAENE